ncbi:VCBS repeat-containing protein [Pyxidicoccus parkwayensis]|uniref:VCBS repeat-containing protein n=1 Tax=Pyxidicoccus parkwayensis TaxID=2813578 RepID=A0ABX7P0T5_9BACT|nr:VCBS repeat-containing protein [Pyxidicoccus parkwaysis]QSQ21938.1 VCBS repeat-containing protein [Pyxidicoccus parkwaysis]
MNKYNSLGMAGAIALLCLLQPAPSFAESRCSLPEPPPTCDTPTDPEPGTTDPARGPRWIHQSKPFFVIGLFDYPQYATSGAPANPNQERSSNALTDFARSGVNTVKTDLPTLTAADLDRMERFGVHAIGEAWNWKPLDVPGHELHWVRETSQHVVGSALDLKIQEVKGKEAFLAYDSHDEMGWNKEGPGQIARFPDGTIDWTTTAYQRARIPSIAQAVSFRDFVNTRDPAHHVFYNEVAALGSSGRPDFTRSQFRAWQPAANAWSQDNYPIYFLGAGDVTPPYPTVDLNSVGNTVDAMKSIYDDDDQAPHTPTGPILMVLQGQGYNECCYTWGGDSRRGRRPVFEEQRFMAFTSVIHGARGVTWWGTEDIELDSTAWHDILRVASQLRYLEPALNSTDELTVTGLPTALEAIHRRVGQRNYLIVANHTDQNVIGVIHPPAWRTALGVRVLFEGPRTVSYAPLLNGWADTFAPWDVHVYTDAPLTHQKDDFDGDGVSDPSWYWTSPALPELGHFTVQASSMPRPMRFPAGENDDVPLTGDYDGDGITDFALHKARSSTINWGGWFSVWLSSAQQWRWFTLGQPGDLPVAADYDGDGTTDFAVYHRYSSPVYDSRAAGLVYGEFQWQSSLYGDLRTFPVGEPDDTPVVGDFDGDGKDDFALYKRRTASINWGGWFTVWRSASQAWQWVNMGQEGDLPVIGDYDGDGASDFALYTPRWPANDGGGYYTLRYSSNGLSHVVSIGEPDDVPVSGDYDGDGRTDVAVYKRRSSTIDWGGWYTIRYSASGTEGWPSRTGVRPGEMPAGLAWQQ